MQAILEMVVSLVQQAVNRTVFSPRGAKTQHDISRIYAQTHARNHRSMLQQVSTLVPLLYPESRRIGDTHAGRQGLVNE